MSAFRFGLQKVLDLRAQTEQARARALADAERMARAAEARLSSLREIRDAEATKLVKAHGESRHVGHLRNLNWAVERLSDRVELAEEACREASEKVESSRSELVDAMTRRQVMDTLKEKKEQAWRDEMKSDEQRRMDELALTRYQRRDENGGQR